MWVQRLFTARRRRHDAPSSALTFLHQPGLQGRYVSVELRGRLGADAGWGRGGRGAVLPPQLLQLLLRRLRRGLRLAQPALYARGSKHGVEAGGAFMLRRAVLWCAAFQAACSSR
jgi:hypothetical protein